MTRFWQRLTLVFFCGYFVLLWLNLHHLPIPWIDEVGYLDPAWNAWKTGTFASNLWPHQGADTQFMAHLPTLQWVHFCTFTLLPHTIWFTRLPLSIVFLAGALIWVRWLKLNHLSAFALFVWATLFLCDRSVFEAARSMRMESIELLLSGLAFFLVRNKKFGWLGLTLGLLMFTHPKVWVIGFVIFTYGFVVGSRSNRWRLIGGAIAPLVGYLVQINGDVTGWYHQLVSHGSDHTIAGIPGNRLWQHFVGRYQLYNPVSQTFDTYYHWQVYVPVIQWLALIAAIRRVLLFIQNRRSEPNVPLLAMVFVINHIYWFALVGPFQKYNMVVLAMGYALFLMEVAKLSSRTKQSKQLQYTYLMMLPLVVVPVALRHAGAILQWEERDTKTFNTWLFEQIDPTEKTLLVECASAWYETRKVSNVDFQFQFFLFNNKFEDYDKVYYITHRNLPFKKQVTYEPLSASERFISVDPGGVTHDGLHLYLLSEPDFNSLVEEFRRK